jgi:chromosome segregation ATPase
MHHILGVTITLSKGALRMFRLFRASMFLLTLCLCFTFSAGLCAQVKTDAARSEWMRGYVKLESADKAGQAGNKLAALQLYREAVLVFEAVRRQFPEWNPSLLNFRIKYCQQKISELEQSVQSEAEAMSREGLLELAAKQAQMMHDSSLEIQQLNTSVNILTEALQRARSEAAKNAAAESDFGTLQAARQELESRCQLLQSKLSKAEADLLDLRKQSADRNLLKKAQDENRQQADQLKESARQLELLQGSLKNLRAELDKAKLDNDRHSQLGLDYEKRLQAATTRIAELTGMLNDLHLQHNALKLKNQQQEIDNNFQKESNQRLTKEKAELLAETQQLRDLRNKFAALQDANQALRSQVLDRENRLQESAEKSRFEVQKRDQQIEEHQATANRLRADQQAVMAKLQDEQQAALSKLQDEHKIALTRLQGEHEAALAKLQNDQQAAMAKLQAERQTAVDEAAMLKAEQITAAEKQRQELIRLQQELAKTNEQLAEMRQQSARLEAEKAELGGKISSEQELRQGLTEKAVEQDRSRADLLQSISGLEKKAAEDAREKTRLAESLRASEEKWALSQKQAEEAIQEKTRLTAALRSSEEKWALLQKQANEAIQKKTDLLEALRVSEEKLSLLEKDRHSATELLSLRQSHAALQTSAAQSKAEQEKLQAEINTARKEALEAGQNLRRSQDYVLTLEKQLQQLQETQKEFSDISRQLQNKDELLSGRDETLRQQAERLATTNALVLAKTDEVQSARVEILALKRRLSDMETLNGRLNEQLAGVIRRQTEFDKTNLELRARLLEETKERENKQAEMEKQGQELTAKTALSIRLEKALAEAERKIEERSQQLAAEQKKAQGLQDDLSSSKTKTAAVDGLTSNLIDLQNQLKNNAEEFAQLKNELETRETRVAILTEQLKRRDEQIKELDAVKDNQAERVWLNRLADLNSKLEQEENRRKALEIALIQKEAETRKSAAEPTPAAPSISTPTTSQTAGTRVYTERDILLNGFLRQALDAEKNRKTEAAMWNYQKVLELEPGHLLALKRSGLIAANNGNDSDTVKYLKLAFRYDPDDPEVLLALGYAMINLQQPEWAFSYLGRAVALEPANPTLSRLFGGALVDLGWTQAAENQFGKALKLNPKDPHSAFNLAVLCATANPPRMQEAKKWYEMAIKNGAEKDPHLEAEFK